MEVIYRMTRVYLLTFYNQGDWVKMMFGKDSQLTFKCVCYSRKAIIAQFKKITY